MTLKADYRRLRTNKTKKYSSNITNLNGKYFSWKVDVHFTVVDPYRFRKKYEFALQDKINLIKEREEVFNELSQTEILKDAKLDEDSANNVRVILDKGIGFLIAPGMHWKNIIGVEN